MGWSAKLLLEWPYKGNEISPHAAIFMSRFVSNSYIEVVLFHLKTFLFLTDKIIAAWWDNWYCLYKDILLVMTLYTLSQCDEVHLQICAWIIAWRILFKHKHRCFLETTSAYRKQHITPSSLLSSKVIDVIYEFFPKKNLI